MHGIIFKELQRYVSKKFGLQAWYEFLKSVELDKKLYLPTQSYPDEEIKSLILAISHTSGLSMNAILEEFGESLVPHLLQIYGSMLQPHWKTLDLIEHTESTMHRAVRFVDHTAAPPRLVCTRISPHEVLLTYTSHRKMSSMGIGIIRGIAKYYGEQVKIMELNTTEQEPLGSSRIQVQLIAD